MRNLNWIGFWLIVCLALIISIGATYPPEDEYLHKIGDVPGAVVYTFKYNQHRCFVVTSGGRMANTVDLECP